MLTPPTVCVLTAGRGSRMGALCERINKALLPVDGRAIVTHIIERFPSGTRFVIALGYLGHLVREYLDIAHPGIAIDYVEVDRTQGPGSGPGYSLLCCREHLRDPFYFVSCDTLFEADLTKAPDTSWIGVSLVPADRSSDYCTVECEDGSVVKLHDKAHVEHPVHAFTGLLFVADPEPFFRGLGSPQLISGEQQISSGLQALMEGPGLESFEIDWMDLGDVTRYREALEKDDAFDFSKTEECIYFVGDYAVKFFADSNVARDRIRRAEYAKHVFPEISRVGRHFYSYRFVPGRTLYQIDSPRMLEKLLPWLEGELWKPSVVPPNRMFSLCQQFYREKTLQRCASFVGKYKEDPLPMRVNGVQVAPVAELLEQVPWQVLCSGVPVFIHGDLQFDNILHCEATDSFLLLDWRQNFAGEVAFGDLYYDLAKLLGGTMIHYDLVKLGRFSFQKEVSEEGVRVEFPQRPTSNEYRRILRNYVGKRGLDFERIELLTALIFLNMSPLHHAPFDRALHAFGRLCLTEALGRYDGATSSS